MSQRPSKSRLRTFTLRTGLLLFIALCIAFGFAANWYHQVRAQGELQLALVEQSQESYFRNIHHYTTTYAQEGPVDRWTSFVRERVHPEYRRKLETLLIEADLFEGSSNLDPRKLYSVNEVYVTKSLPSESFAKIFEIPGLKRLSFFWSVDHIDLEPTDMDWSVILAAKNLEELTITTIKVDSQLGEALGKLPSLHTIRLTNCSVEGLARLAKSRSLKSLRVSLENPPYRNPLSPKPKEILAYRQSQKAVFDELAENAALEELSLGGSFPIEPQDIEKFCTQSRVQKFTLGGILYAEGSLAKFATLKSLVHAEFRGPGMDDDRLLVLKEAKNLKTLRVEFAIPSVVLDKLRKSLPNCQVLAVPAD